MLYIISPDLLILHLFYSVLRLAFLFLSCIITIILFWFLLFRICNYYFYKLTYKATRFPHWVFSYSVLVGSPIPSLCLRPFSWYSFDVILPFVLFYCLSQHLPYSLKSFFFNLPSHRPFPTFLAFTHFTTIFTIILFSISVYLIFRNIPP